MADIPMPYRPFDLVQSGLQAAGQGVDRWNDEQLRMRQEAKMNEPEHPMVVEFIRRQLARAGVPPQRMEAAVERALGGLRTSDNKAQTQAPVQAAPQQPQQGLFTPEQTGAPVVPPVSSPSNIHTAGGFAAAQASEAMQGGVQGNSLPPGPAQQSLSTPLSLDGPRMFTGQTPAQPAPMQAPAQPNRINQTNPAQRSSTWTKGDTARFATSLPSVVGANSREDVANINAEAKQRVAMKRDETLRDLARFRAMNADRQLAAKLENASQRAVLTGDIQSQNNFFDFAADIMRIEEQYARLQMLFSMKQGDWKVEAVKIMQRMAATDAALSGRMSGSLNLDAKMRQQMEDIMVDVKDKQNSAARMMDTIGTERGSPDFVRPEGAKNSRGEELEQGGKTEQPLAADPSRPSQTKGMGNGTAVKADEPAPAPKKTKKKAAAPEPEKKVKKPAVVTPQANKLLGLMGKGK